MYLNPLAHIELDANINDGDLLIFEFKSTSSYRARRSLKLRNSTSNWI